MRSGTRRVIQASFLLSTLGFAAAYAQFGQGFPGFVNLPDQDFTWNWGRTVDTVVSRAEDFSIRGSQAQFRCELSGRFSAGSHYTSTDARELANRLQSSLFFIEDAAYTMDALDRQRELDWATLSCEEPKRDESEQASQEREDRAREKALKDLQKRRERRAHELERAESD